MSDTRINMPTLSVETTIRHLSRVYCEIVKKGISPKVLPSVMLWGPPGVGKSQGIRQVAKEIAEKCEETVNSLRI